MASFQQAVTAIQLLAVNDCLKSICISGPIGSGKTQLLSLYLELSDRPQVVIPTHVTMDRLYGCISLNETLQQQKVVYEKSIFERTDQGCLIVEQFELLESMIARTIVRAIEEQSIQFVRDEVLEKQLSHTALFTMQVSFDQLPAPLLDCIGLSLTLDIPTYEQRIAVLSNKEMINIETLKQKVKEARNQLPHVRIKEEELFYIAEQLAYYGLHSMRAHYSWVQAARAFAALQQEGFVTKEHIQAVCEYVLNHRANIERQQPEAETPPTPSQREQNYTKPQQSQGDDMLVEVEAENHGAMSIEVENSLQTKKVQSGKASRNKTSKKQGRQIGIQPYKKTAPDLDILATLKKAIPEQPLYEKDETMIVVKPHHFVNKKREQKQAQHFIFIVDASQSMHQYEQMTAVKGIVLSLIKDAYQKRNMISFISMYQQQADIQLHTSKNISLARQMLQNLKVGGKTPLASALALSQSIIETSMVPVEATKLIIITDGRANITLAGEKHVKQALQESFELAEQLQKLGVQTLVVDTEQGKVKLQKAKQLAEVLQGHYIQFSDFSNLKTYHFIRKGG